MYARASIAAIVVAAMALGPASAEAAVNPVLSGWVSDSVTLPGTTAVALAGHFAYVTNYYAGRLTAIDISNPAAPVIAGSSEASNGLLNASTVNIAGGYAYVVSKNRNGPSGSGSNDDGTGNSLTILDITSNPASPTIVGSVRDANTLFGGYGVAVSGHYAFVASQGCLGGQPCPNSSVGNAFAVVDIRNPASPSIVATIHNTALPPPWNGTGAFGHATSVAISGNYAYVTAAYQNRLTVVNIANPLSPTIVASIKDNTNLSFPVDVAVSGQYAYVTDQISTGRLTVVNVSNPTNPQVVASLASSTLNGAYRVRVRGDFAYVSASSAADVAVVDISNPLSPRVAASVANETHLHRTTGLDVDPSGRYVVASSPYLSSQSQPLYPPYALQTGGPTLTGTVSAITLDPSPIVASISSGSRPANPTAQTSANFSFSVNDAVAAVQCQLDAGSWLPCTTQTSQVYSGLGAGSHTFAVQAIDAAGNISTSSYSWTVTAPANTSPPSISGSAAVGQVLSSSTGSWTGSPTFAYQWLRCNVIGLSCLPIAGASSSSYTAVVADAGSTLEAQVTATTSAGSTSIESSPTAAVTAPPANTSPPSISGSATQGQVLSASPGSWSGYPEPTYAYQWQRCDQNGLNCNAIGGANTSTYTLGAADAGSTIVVTVEASNTAGSTQANSTPSPTVTGAPANTSPPSISGSPTQGQVLSASPGSWSGYPEPTYAYQWQRCDQSGLNCNTISGANVSTYTLGAADVGSTLVVAVTASNSAGSASVESSPSAVVAGVPVNTVLPTVSGVAAQGVTLSASPGSWTGAPSFTYQWERCNGLGQGCAGIPGATASSYTVLSADVGSTLVVAVTASNSAGSASVESSPTATVAAPPASTSPPSISGSPTQGQVLSASPGSWSGYPEPTYAYQWQRCDQSGLNCNTISGANVSTYTLGAADVGSTLVVAVTASNSAGSAQASSAASTVVTAAPVSTSPPTIVGYAQQGVTLSASPGSWSGYPAPTFAYQWMRCTPSGAGCTVISGATTASYTPVSADVGQTVELAVTATNSSGSASANSAPSSTVRPPAGTIIEYKLPSTVSTPSGITKGPDGNVWFATEHGGTVGKITPSGAVGLYSVAPSTSSLGGITTGPDANIWFTDHSDSRIERMTPAGTNLTLFPITGTPGLGGITAGADGNIWFAESEASILARISTTGSGYTTFPTLTAGAWPHGVNPGPDGNLWFAEIKASKVGRVAPSGSLSEWTIPTANSSPRVIVTGADGNVWFTEFTGNKIGRITPSGSIAEFSVPTAASGPVGIAQGQDGYVWFTEQSGDKVGRITMSGSVTEFFVPTAAAQPDKIVLGADGNLWFTERSANQIGTIISGPPVSVAPANLIGPLVSGVPTQGQTLRATQGSWSGLPAPSYSYQWNRCDQTGANCAAIPGATASSYTVLSADVGSTLVVAVTASNSAGSASVESSPTATVAAPPASTSPPSISGSPTQGQVLSASPGSWSGYPEPTYAYQWQRCDQSGLNCNTISGANVSTYTLGAADVGSTLVVAVTASNSAGSTSARSTPTTVVTAASANLTPPTITGTATEGQVLTATPGSWSGYPAPSLAYQWERCNGLGQGCAAIPGATSSSYTALSADVSSTLVVEVTASNSAGSAQASSTASAVVVSAAGPLTLLLDNFARPNNTGPPGPNWTHMVVSSSSSTNDLFITNQQVTGRSGSNADYWNPQTFGPNSEAWVTVAVKPNIDLDPVVLGLRFQNPGATNASGYQAYYIYRSRQADQYKIISRTNGTTSTTLASVNGPTLNPGDQLLFRAIGTTLELWRFDAGAWTRLLSATDSTYQNAGYLNLTARDGAVRLTNFGGGTLP
jgi:streptogramin lyase